MEAAFAELPLALFTTLAPLGAGAFVALAAAFFTTSFSAEETRKIDRMTIVALAVVLVGFACSFAHLAAPGNAFGVFSGMGTSPLSNEIAVGSLFVVVAIVYTALAVAGKLNGSARKGFVAVVAVLAIVFALFTGLAYVMPTIASWNTPAVPVQMIGFCLLGGSGLGVLLLGLAGALQTAIGGSFKKALVVLAVLGVVLGVGGFAAQVSAVGGMQTAMVSGAALVAEAFGMQVAAIVCLLGGCALTLVAARGNGSVVLSGVAVVCLVLGVFLARLVFYAVQMSVGL